MSNEYLLVGEADRSFTLALARLLWSKRHRASYERRVARRFLQRYDDDELVAHGDADADVRLISSTFESSREELDRKYAAHAALHAALPPASAAARRTTLVYGVNACALDASFDATERRFRAIIWNHPHLGVEDDALHHRLLRHFFASAAPLLDDSDDAAAYIIVTQLDGQLLRFRTLDAAARVDCRLVRVLPFDAAHYTGYARKRNQRDASFTNGHAQMRNERAMRSTTYVFRRAPPAQLIVAPPSPPPAERPLPHACAQCARRFATSAGVQSHVHEVHAKPRQATRPCSRCERTFGDEQALLYHFKAVHEKDDVDDDDEKREERKSDGGSGASPATPCCSICGFPSDNCLADLTPAVELTRRCAACGKHFVDDRAVSQHAKYCHQ